MGLGAGFVRIVFPWLVVLSVAACIMFLFIHWAYDQKSPERFGTAGVALSVLGGAVAFGVTGSYFRAFGVDSPHWAIPLIFAGSNLAFIGLRLVCVATLTYGSQLAGAIHALGLAFVLEYFIDTYGVQPSPLIAVLHIAIYLFLAIAALYFLLFLVNKLLTARRPPQERGTMGSRPLDWFGTTGALVGLISSLIQLAEKLKFMFPRL